MLTGSDEMEDWEQAETSCENVQIVNFIISLLLKKSHTVRT